MQCAASSHWALRIQLLIFSSSLRLWIQGSKGTKKYLSLFKVLIIMDQNESSKHSSHV